MKNKAKTEKVKTEKIKTTGVRRIAIIVLWTIIAFIFVRGVLSILNGNNQREIYDMLAQNKAESDMISEQKIGAASFAERFIQEYYTYSGRIGDDYEQRIGNYLASFVELRPFLTNRTATEVISANTFDLHFYDKNQIDADVMAKIKYTILNTENDVDTTIIKNIALRVPITGAEGRYTVTAIPVMIPIADKAVASRNDFVGSEVDTSQKNEIKDVLESFLKAYYEGTENELSYYLSSDSKLKKGLEGRISFQRLEYLAVYGMPEPNQYIANVNLTVLDQGLPIQQKFYVTLIKENRYYIQSIQTRAEE